MKTNELEARGKRLKAYREAKDLSQEQLAEKINLSPEFVQMLEQGTRGMSLETLVSLKKVLELDIDYLLFGDVSRESKYPLVNEIMKLDESKIAYAEQMMAAFVKSHTEQS